jgi:putative two-component system response regulator
MSDFSLVDGSGAIAVFAHLISTSRPRVIVKPQIVFVDDEQSLLDLYRRMLRAHVSAWDLHFISDSRTAWEFLQNNSVDAVVSDVTMPHITGLELLQRLRAQPSTRDVPVTMLTGLSDAGLKRQVLDLGATDLLNKPVQALDLVARLRSMLRLKSVEDELKRRNQDLEQIVQQRTRQLRHSRLQIVWRLGKAAEFRDEETGEHVVRVGCCSRILAEAMGLPDPILDELFLAAPLHDIGKIGIPDAILLKTGRLTEEERYIMQTHCELGERILREPSLTEVCTRLESADFESQPFESDSLMLMARQIAMSHHERWDGQGYPRRLQGTEIPLAARIVGVADVYDALTSARPYKQALSHQESMRIITSASGTQFDPKAVDALLQSQSSVVAVRQHVANALRRVVDSTAAESPFGADKSIRDDSSFEQMRNSLLSPTPVHELIGSAV